MIAETTKKCCRCKELKPLDSFSPDRRKSFGRASRCKPCGAAIKRASDEKCRNDPERMAIRRAQHNAWRKTNLEYQRARSRAKRHSEVSKKTRAEYLAKHPGMMAAFAAARRALHKAAMPPWADRRAIADLYRDAKELSAATDMIWHVDHIIPLQHPLVCGLHIAANLQLLPGLDNQRKSNSFVAA